MGDPNDRRNSLAVSISKFFGILNEFLLPSVVKVQQSLSKNTSNTGVGLTTISFSHFLPKAELYTPRKEVFRPLLTVMGCPLLGRTVCMLQANVHIFGHSHLSFDKTLPLLNDELDRCQSGSEVDNDNEIVDVSLSTTHHDSKIHKNTDEENRYTKRILTATECRFVQQALGYPQERKKRPILATPALEKARTMPKCVWSKRKNAS